MESKQESTPVLIYWTLKAKKIFDVDLYKQKGTMQKHKNDHLLFYPHIEMSIFFFDLKKKKKVKMES